MIIRVKAKNFKQIVYKMNYILFIMIAFLLILLGHFVYGRVYDSVNTYTTYEKNIECVGNKCVARSKPECDSDKCCNL